MNRPNHSFLRSLRYERVHHFEVNFSIHYDGLGIRVNNPNLLTKSADILDCGESTAWGFGLENEATFASILGRQANLSVANASIPGAGPATCYRQFMRLAPILKPKYMVLYWWAADHEVNVRRCAGADVPYCFSIDRIAPAPDGGLRFDFVDPAQAARNWTLMKRWYRETTTASGRMGSFWTDVFWTQFVWGQEILNAIGYFLPDRSADEKEAATFLMANFAKLAKDNGARPVVVYVPWFYSPSAPNFADVARALSVDFVSTEPLFEKLKNDQVDFMYPDGHLNAAGHATLGNYLHKWGQAQKLW